MQEYSVHGLVLKIENFAFLRVFKVESGFFEVFDDDVPIVEADGRGGVVLDGIKFFECGFVVFVFGVLFENGGDDNSVEKFDGEFFGELDPVIVGPSSLLDVAGDLEPAEEVSLNFKTHLILIIYWEKFYQSYYLIHPSIKPYLFSKIIH